MKSWSGRFFGIAAMAFMLCLTGLAIPGEAQAQRFVDNGNGTVTDTATNLMWTKNADPFGKLNWHDAMAGCRSFSISGVGGWRLPNRDELLGLASAVSGGHPFTGVQSSWYWSNTTYAGLPDFAWYVQVIFSYADYDLKTLTGTVWPVRASQ